MPRKDSFLVLRFIPLEFRTGLAVIHSRYWRFVAFLSPIGMFIAFCYIWLPYMIVPIQTALERVPKSLLEASSDLGANPAQTFRNVILPAVLPGCDRGSIFTFSLTLGRFHRPASRWELRAFSLDRQCILYQGTAGNIPLAAALTMGPVVIMIVYLLIARKLGAFDAL